MNQLFELMYGKDVQKYVFLKGKGTTVDDNDDPRCLFQYDHSTWKGNYESFLASISSDSSAAKSLGPQLDQCCQEVSSGASNTSEPSLPSPFTDMPSANSLPVMVSTQAPMEQSESSATTPTPVTEASMSTNSSSVIDLTDSSSSEMLKEHAEWLTAISTLTRRKLSDVSVPQVSVTSLHSTSNVTTVFGAYSEKDPLSLNKRPPERVVEEAVKAF